MDVETIVFTGGEPFLSERFEEVVLFTRLQNKKVSIITNGNLAKDDSLKRILKMGVQLFELPYHSARPEIHDSMTNKKGSWQKSFDSIQNLIKIGAYTVPVIILTKLNFQYIEETLESLAKLGIKRIIVNRFNIGGNGINNANELLMTTDELQNTYKKINKTTSDLGLQVSSNVCTPICILNPKEYENIEFGFCSHEVLYRPLTLDLNGNMRLCNHSPIAAGNIFNDSIENILSSEYANSWAKIKPTFCTDCDDFANCLGGCRAASEQLNKTLYEVDPIIPENNLLNRNPTKL